MKKYETLHLVKSEDLNHHGTLFAARATAWLVEAGFAVAACEHGNPDEIVLRGMKDMSFSKPVPKGTVLCYEGLVVQVGNTSMVVCVKAKNAITGEQYIEGYITFVTIDAGTALKKEHNLVLDDTADTEEFALREKAARLRNDSR